ncbi:MAG: hypothetical protein KDE48_00585 [Anaerolineales bacterium]|nr:hypothetical protein [Anaerolineales bacterium]
MSKQNRVQPDGRIIATDARGTFMGNRGGTLHNDNQELVRQARTKGWIICVLEFKNRQRKIMTPGEYTELFFLDEATALAAGHRPCHECRRERALAFRAAMVTDNPLFPEGAKTKFPMLDDVLQRERMTEAYFINDRRKRTYLTGVGALPNGVFIFYNQDFYLIWGNKIYGWTPTGYLTPAARPVDEDVVVLTPLSTVAALRSGYVPDVHVSAELANSVPHS